MDHRAGRSGADCRRRKRPFGRVRHHHRAGHGYDSPNYAWFEERFDTHCYLDRIVVAPTHRRTGVASLLYDEIKRALPVTLEVYAEPPNDPSLAFHAARGYEEIGRLPQGNGKVAAMFVKSRAVPAD